MAGKPEDDKSFVTYMMLMILAGGFLWALWYFTGHYILEALRWIRIGELWLLEKATMDEEVGKLRTVASRAPSVGIHQVLVLSYVAMKYIKWIFAAFLLGVAYYIMTKSPQFRFKTKHTLQTLMETQAKSWPVISPVIKFNPTKFSSRAPGKPIPRVLPAFAEALSPEEWIAYNRIPLINGAPEREAIRRAFIAQLGPRWTGPQSLPPYAQGLYAAFALKNVKKRKESDELLGEIAKNWTIETGLVMPGSLLASIKKWIDDKEVGGEAAKIVSKHAYVATALLGLLKQARISGGVLAPATFLWLRAVDRNLWYPLNNLGRQSFHVEASGAISHFMGELSAGKALVVPRLEQAIDAMNAYLAEQKPTIPKLEEK